MSAAPPLSMLWEPLDPAEALRQRFGFGNAAAAVAWLTEAVEGAWSITVEDCDRLVMSAGNLLAWITSGDRRLIAKWSVIPHLFPRLAGTTDLTAWLGSRGIPVAAPVPASDGRLRVELGAVSPGVCPVVEGDLLDVGDPAQVIEAGHPLARLHEALAAYPRRIDGRRPADGEQLVQNDFRSANLLHDGRRIAAVLDFEDATYRTPIADLARAAVLLGTRYHNWSPTGEDVRAAFITAYQHHHPLTSAAQQELQRGVAAVLAAFGWR